MARQAVTGAAGFNAFALDISFHLNGTSFARCIFLTGKALWRSPASEPVKVSKCRRRAALYRCASAIVRAVHRDMPLIIGGVAGQAPFPAAITQRRFGAWTGG
jgi:hypothetical protein